MDEREEMFPELPADPAEAEAERRRAAWEALLAEARRFFEAAPPYRIQFEDDGMVSLRRKEFAASRLRDQAAAATVWRILSAHPTLEEAERRLRHVTSPPVHYDLRGRVMPLREG
ncbi:MAG TPA: hypothetical protein VE033_19560 [Acetobacteraceae bacterium]|nr:hypothetical protein [Acetobacteraceae bacterium]